MKKIKYVLIGFFVLILVSLPLASYLAYVNYYAPSVVEDIAFYKNIYPKVIKDLKLIESAKLFTKTTYERNADDYLSKYISWQGQDIQPLEANKTINEFIVRYKGWNKDPKILFKMLNDPMLNKIDTSWLNEIEKFDHWDMSSNAHMAPLLEKAQRMDGLSKYILFAGLPIPSYSELQSWSIIHFLKMYKDKRPIEALKVFRKTREILYSSGLTISAMVVVNYFTYERYLVEQLKIKNWPTYDKETVMAFKRTSWAWAGLVRHSLNEPLPSELLKYAKYENGLCGAAWDTSTTSLAQDSLAPYMIFEVDHRDEIARLQLTTEKILAECHLDSFKIFNTRTPASVETSIFHQGEADQIFTEPYFMYSYNLSKIPYLRRILAYRMIPTAVWSYFVTLYN